MAENKIEEAPNSKASTVISVVIVVIAIAVALLFISNRQGELPGKTVYTTVATSTLRTTSTSTIAANMVAAAQNATAKLALTTSTPTVRIGNQANLTASWNWVGATHPFSMRWYEGASGNCLNDTKLLQTYNSNVSAAGNSATGSLIQMETLNQPTYFCYELIDAAGRYAHSSSILINITAS